MVSVVECPADDHCCLLDLFWIICLFCKVLPDFRRNLTIRHLVNCFNADDAPTKFVSLETFLQLALGLTRPKYQNRFCITNTRNHRIVVNVEMSRELSFAGIICRYLL